MKLTAIVALSALVLFSGCGSERLEADETILPVDIWSPFVQVVPPGNIWKTQTNESTVGTSSSETNDPGHGLVYIDSFRVYEGHWQRIMYEQQRVQAFFPPDVTHPLFSTIQEFPDFFGGFLGGDFYTAVLIVMGKEEEAADFLAYIDEFETIKIRFVPRGFNELRAVHLHIINANVQPQPWFVFKNQLEGYVQVELFDYSDEEKAFFREHVLDSPLVRFYCVFELFGDNVLEHFPFYNPLFSPPIHENQLSGVSISSQIFDDQTIVTHIYFDTDTEALHVRYARLMYYNNGRWIPLIGYNPSMFIRGPDLIFSPGLNIHEFNTSYFTRTFEGVHKVEFLVTDEDFFDWYGFHLLSYIFLK